MTKLETLGAFEIVTKIRSQEVSVCDVVDHAIKNIQIWNPKLNAVVENCFEKAIAQAKLADQQISEGQIDWIKTPLFGVPFTIKEMICVEGMRHTSGAQHMKNYVAKKDATVVSRMRNSGAIILGTTNVPEVGMWFECDNTVYGETRNPYDLTRTPGGSSGGEAAIIGSGASIFGLGSDIGGSLRIPAAFCGVFTHKPSEGIVPNTGHNPLYEESMQEFQGSRYPFMVIGPISRKAKDLFPLLKIISGPDGIDPMAVPFQFQEKVNDWSKIKVFFMPAPVIHGAGEAEKELQDAVAHSARYLQELGAKTEALDAKIFVRAFDIWTGRSWAMERDFNLHLTGGPSLNFAKEFLNISLGRGKFTLPALLTAFYDKSFRSEKLRLEFLMELQLVKSRLAEILGTNGVLILPPHPRVAPKLKSTLSRPFDFAYTAIFNALGNPATIAPCGIGSEGLPLSVQIVASPMQDHLTISAAEVLEQAFGGWQSPPQT